MTYRSRMLVFVALNLAGMAVYFYFNQVFRVFPEEGGMPSRTGNAIYWALTQAPILLLYFVVNAAVLVAVARRARKFRQRSALYPWLSVIAMWVAVVIVVYQSGHGFGAPQFLAAIATCAFG